MKEEKKYFPQLDTIRGISVLAVFIFHSYKPIFGESFFEKFIAFVLAHLGMGLDVFFILSSFLLTFLGMNEFETTGKFSFKNYFIRRALRIWPLYFIIMFFSFVILKILQNYTGHQITLPPAGWYVLFVSNFYLPDHVFFLRLLWTLSVEEQFYLLWGFCLLVFQKYLKIVILILATISLAFIIIQTIKEIGIYFHTLTYIIDMMFGAFAAYSIKKNNKIAATIKILSSQEELIFYLSFPLLFLGYFLVSFLVSEVLHNLFTELIRLCFITYCSVVIIIQMITEKRKLDLSNYNFLIFTGKISFGLYCFHGMVISFGYLFLKKINLSLTPFVTSFCFLIFTYLLAILSYKLIERPFLKLKDKRRSV